MRLVPSLLLLLPAAVSAYQSWQEGEYLNNFAHLESKSYSAANDAGVAPAGLLAECRADATALENDPDAYFSSVFDGNTVELMSDGGVDAINPNVPTVSAASAQIQCGYASTCVVPRGLRLIMSSSLNVYSLIIRGELYWRDLDQVGEEQYLCGGIIAAEGEGGRFIMNLAQGDGSGNGVGDKRGWIYVKDNGAHHHHGKTRFFGGIGDHGEDGPIVEVTGRHMTRTWSLLSRPFEAHQTSIKLMHSPVRMGWLVGDRIGIASTQKTSDGTGHSFNIVGLDDDGTIHLDGTFTNGGHRRQAQFLSPTQAASDLETRSAALMTAEVVNLSRNIVITGDDFRHVPCNTPNVGCGCGESKSKCTLGLHTAQMHAGTMSVRNARVEKCGQRGVMGKYCLHFHRLSDCPTCEFSGNSIEHGHQRGIIVHGTHRTSVSNNVLWDVRGAGIYIEDGNEMANQLKYNVVICPWPLIDGKLRGCTIPGTDNAESDTPLNQAGIYLETANNDLIGNRVSNSFNGLLLQASGSGKGAAYGGVCTAHLSFGRWEGNTFHGHSRFGLYSLGGSFPRDTDQSLERDGFNADQSNTCKGTTNEGIDRGLPVSLLNNVDWHTIFVGHYNAGDMQHRGHVSVSNNNLIYWKETKNFADGCSAHISNSYYTNGNMALPDDSTFIMERTTFEGYIVLEANHHCNVGVTGHLCMPSYIFHDVLWMNNPAPTWMWLQRGGTGGGGVFSLSPPNANAVMIGTPEEQAEYEFGKMFPPGYVSVASSHYSYLLSTPWCTTSGSIGKGTRYTNGILCRRPLRVVKVWSTNLNKSSAPNLKIEVWLNNTQPGTSEQASRNPTIVGSVNFHQIADLGGSKQGYSLPVFISDYVSYRLSLGDAGDPIPGDWVIEFSDPVMGNRWGEEFVNLDVTGRVCEYGGVVSSQHSRRFIGGSPGGGSWGVHGACVNANPPPKMNPVDCAATRQAEDVLGADSASSCPDVCSPSCDPANSYCHCEFGCLCKPGFAGAACSIDLCASARCAEHGVCSARYLGDSSSLPVSNQACVCDKGWHGPLCDKQNSKNLARAEGVSASQSSTDWDGYPWRAVDGSTAGNWGSNSITHTKGEYEAWWMLDLGVDEQPIAYVIMWNRWDECCRDRFADTEVQILDSAGVIVATRPIVNSLRQNHVYFDENTIGRFVRVQKVGVTGTLNIAEVQVFAEATCASCTATSDCTKTSPCNNDGSCPSSLTLFVENGTPCNSEPMGTCQDGQCVGVETLPPSYEPTPSPFTLAPTVYKMAERTGLVTGAATAEQSSTCYGGGPNRAIDGNTDGNWYHNSVQHTCASDANAYYKVTLDGSYNHVISMIKVWNRSDCCGSTLINSEVQILDGSDQVVARSQLIAGEQREYTFHFDNVTGRSVRVWKTVAGPLTIAEVAVVGWVLSQTPTVGPSLSPVTATPTVQPTISARPTAASITSPSSSPTESYSPTRSPATNLAVSSGAQASQSSTCYGGGANRAKDGNTDGNYWHNSVQHTCGDANAWWKVSLDGSYGHVISMIKVWNRNDCCDGSLINSEVQVLDGSGQVVARSQPITGRQREYSFNFDNVAGQAVRVWKNVSGGMTLAEVQVFGWAMSQSPTPVPTGQPIISAKPTPATIEYLTPIINLARVPGVTASQSTTYNGMGAGRAKDGVKTDGSSNAPTTHTQCGIAQPWWRAKIGLSAMKTVKVYNRNDCCWSRLGDFTVSVLDSDMNVMASVDYPGTAPRYDPVEIDFTDIVPVGEIVEVRLKGTSCLQLTEVEIYGHEILPPATNLVKGSSVAMQSTTCHGGGPYRAIDGNTDGTYWHNSVTHTCNEASPWWIVTLDPSNVFIVNKVSIWNRSDCCNGSLDGADVQILNSSGNVVAIQPMTGVKGVYHLEFDDVEGARSVRVWKDYDSAGSLTIAEVKVYGWETS